MDRVLSGVPIVPEAPRGIVNLRGELRRLRVQQGISLEDAAKAINSTAGNVSRIERGEIEKPAFIDVVRLAHLYGMPPEELFTLANIPTKEPRMDPEVRRVVREIQSLPKSERVQVLEMINHMLIGRRHAGDTGV